MKALRYGLWGVTALAAIALAWFVVQRPEATGVAAYGGPFRATLVSTEGDRPITRDAMLGRPHAMFFGFTHCPDVCPTTLYEASQWLNALGEDAAKLDVYFVTVDPARDTVAVMRDYLRPFDPRIRAVTGTEAQVADLVNGWNVLAQRTDLEDGGYNVDHTASVFLMRADGSLQGTIAYGEATKTAVEKLERLAGT